MHLIHPRDYTQPGLLRPESSGSPQQQQQQQSSEASSPDPRSRDGVPAPGSAAARPNRASMVVVPSASVVTTQVQLPSKPPGPAVSSEPASHNALASAPLSAAKDSESEATSTGERSPGRRSFAAFVGGILNFRRAAKRRSMLNSMDPRLAEAYRVAEARQFKLGHAVGIRLPHLTAWPGFRFKVALIHPEQRVMHALLDRYHCHLDLSNTPEDIIRLRSRAEADLGPSPLVVVEDEEIGGFGAELDEIWSMPPPTIVDCPAAVSPD